MRHLCASHLVALLAACGADDPDPTTILTNDQCDGSIETVSPISSPHVDIGTPITWPSNPPTSGPHVPIWGGWDREYTSLQRGHWVHNLEHGGVVFAYRCDAGCDDAVSQLREVVRGLPTDPMCVAPIRQRALIVADPELPTNMMFHAVAWGVYYTGSCVDADTLTAFFDAYSVRAPENFCDDGAVLVGASLELTHEGRQPGTTLVHR